MVKIISLAGVMLLAGVPFLSHADMPEWEGFIDAGFNGSQVDFDTNSSLVPDEDDRAVGYHFGVGARKLVAPNHFLGARVELDDIDGDTMLALRAIDYQYQWNQNWRFGAFLGAASLDTGASTTGYYMGLGTSYRDLWPNVDVGFDLRYGDKVARDKFFESDPEGNSPDVFYRILGFSLYLSWRL